MRELIILLILGYILYHTYKYITGTVGVVVIGLISIYLSYLIYTQVIFGVIPSNIKIPDNFLETDKKIEQIKEDYNDYEYRGYK